MKRSKKIFLQFGICIVFISLVGVLINNLTINLIRTGIGFNFSWLFKPASFALAEHSLPYSSSDSYAWALFMGWLNSLKVIFFSLIVISTGIFLNDLCVLPNGPVTCNISDLYVT